ncbi:MAG TPA: HAD-IA family hydrolase, partial [Acidimicrobiia bacterium]|nr:HAD-IA family hydrolase [Acidimicrobiia bacterium]
MGTTTATKPTATVVLDFYGTLAEATEVGPTFDDVLIDLGYTPQGRQSWELLATEAAEHAEHSTSREAYVAWEHARLRQFAEQAGVPASASASVADALIETSKAYRLRLYDETIEVLDALTDRGVRLALCSNWDWDLPDHLTELGLDHYFTPTVVSARAGARKPHPRIYTHLVDGLGCMPSQVLFVGDTWDADVEGPLAHGMRA